MSNRLLRDWHHFQHDEKGSMSVELVLVVPILTWVFLSTFVYFDLFRNEANAHRAALTLADMFSREQVAIDSTYLNSAKALLETVTLDDPDPGYRITVYRYDDADERYYRVWSRSRGITPVIDDADLATLDAAGRLPIMADGDRAILVETRTVYTPAFDTGITFLVNFYGDDASESPRELGNVIFDTFTVIRPRFRPSLCWDLPDPQDDIC